jgi:hypothetical protein
MTTAIGPHIMNSVIDLEAQQEVAQAAPLAGALFPLSHHRRSDNGSQGRGGRSRDARNGYPWASHRRHRQCRKFTAVRIYWPRYQRRGTVSYPTDRRYDLYLALLSHLEMILLQDPGEATSLRRTPTNPAAAMMS